MTIPEDESSVSDPQPAAPPYGARPPGLLKRYRGPFILLYLAGFLEVIARIGAGRLPVSGASYLVALLSGFIYPLGWIFLAVVSPRVAFQNFYDTPVDDLIYFAAIAWLAIRWSRSRRAV